MYTFYRRRGPRSKSYDVIDVASHLSRAENDMTSLNGRSGEAGAAFSGGWAGPSSLPPSPCPTNAVTETAEGSEGARREGWREREREKRFSLSLSGRVRCCRSTKATKVVAGGRRRGALNRRTMHTMDWTDRDGIGD